MPYVPLTEREKEKILEKTGVKGFDELLEGIPRGLRFTGELGIRQGLTEQDLLGHLKELAGSNTSVESMVSFLGAGAYNHYIPSTVDSLISRSEFYTSYTPYQPEISQGTLQAAFEYQTLICQLTAMDISNASLYDGASATAEAALMARRVTRRDGVLLSSALHPSYRETTSTYLQASEGCIREIPFCAETGGTTIEAVEKAITEDTACLVVQHPNFFGCIEELEELANKVHEKGALLIVAVTEPLSLALLQPPGRAGADIVVGEGQSFGNSLNYGGPYFGFMAIREKFLRQMPGRVVGKTLDAEGRSAYCLTFATREQHIRRERATSNICTNQGLATLTAAIYLTSLGRSGLKELARINLSRAAYMKTKLSEIKGVTPAFTGPTFNEFAIRLPVEADKILGALKGKGFIGGLALSEYYPVLKDMLLLCVTEMNSKRDMDGFCAALGDTFKDLG
ncbi:MAG: aminomethyl-transferring glycine dehydrogenase subunit GcvPA [Thermodesulfobacteriota bacterium]